MGGDDSIRLLRHLNLELLAANPKVFLGYSDSTVTQMALLKAGITSFYGPAIMAGFAENGGLHDYLVEAVRRTLFEPGAPYVWSENRDGWTVEHLDWSDPTSQQRRRELRPSTGWRWHGGATRKGATVVGCGLGLDGSPGRPQRQSRAVVAGKGHRVRPSLGPRKMAALLGEGARNSGAG
jgi:muramoyltetrapeptide carboxypeptidase LdcA involved in peptidoglycan recycling